MKTRSRRVHLAMSQSVAGVLLGGAALLAACGPESPRDANDRLDPQQIGQTAAPLTTSDGCQIGDESLPSYARKCKAAMGGLDMPPIDCTKGTEVPDTQGDGQAYPNETCDRPNVLNGECDPGSKFQVLLDKVAPNNQRVVMVAHCRHKNASKDKFKDVAAIAYNFTTGDTCFFQDKAPDIEDTATPPLPVDDANNDFWATPFNVVGMNCVGCHDNGPFIRSPYLTQLKGTPTTESGGAELAPIVMAQAIAAAHSPPSILPGSRDPSWNSTQPYRFVGANFQGWKAYALSVQKSAVPNMPSNECMNCHRMGISSTETFGQFSWFPGSGTSQKFGLLATGDGADRQLHKNPHVGTPNAAATSPIWMLPSQEKYDSTIFSEAKLVQSCAKSIVAGGALPVGCGYAQYAQGDTCQGPGITVTVNGGTVGTTSTDPHVDVIDVPAGPNVAFGGWTMLRGPFVEKSTNVKYGGAGFDGTIAALRVVGNPAHFQVSAGWAGPPANPPRPGAGGKVDFTLYSEIKGVPANPSCGYGGGTDLVDLPGTSLFLQKQVDSGLKWIDAPTTFIGNLSFVLEKDFYGVRESGSASLFERMISKQGAFEGQAFAYGCAGWSPTFSVLHKSTASDIELIAAPNAKKHRCILTGISGDWSATRNNGTVQPYAEIYSSGQSTRLRVAPTTGNDRVYAEASCIQIQ